MLNLSRHRSHHGDTAACMKRIPCIMSMMSFFMAFASTGCRSVSDDNVVLDSICFVSSNTISVAIRNLSPVPCLVRGATGDSPDYRLSYFDRTGNQHFSYFECPPGMHFDGIIIPLRPNYATNGKVYGDAQILYSLPLPANFAEIDELVLHVAYIPLQRLRTFKSQLEMDAAFSHTNLVSRSRHL